MKKQTHRHQNTKARTLSQFRQRTKHYHQIVTTQESGDRVEQHLEWGNAYSFIFDSLASLPQSGCKQHLLKERKQINDYLAGIELQILRQFSRWKLKQLNKLDCLIDFFDKAKLHSIFKVPKRTRGQLQAEHIEVVRVLEGISKREKKDLDQYFCTLADEFAQTLKKSYNKGNNTIELFKQMLASNQYDSTDLGDEGYQAKVKNKVTHFKTKLRTEFNKLKDIADILISEESQKDCRIATVHSCNIQNEQKEQQRQPKNVFQIDFDEKMSKSMQNPSLSKSCFVEEFGLKNEQFKSKMTINLSKSRQIQKKEIHTRINYGKRHYPIQINEDLETQRMRLIFLRNNLKRRKENIKAKQEIPHGLQMRGDEVLIIWNGKKRTQIMNFIFLNKKVKYLIINDKTMATRLQIKKILKFNQGIQGIDLNCDNYVQLNQFTPYKLKFFNCFKSFRFMREKDTVKYFPWKKQSIRSHSEDLLQNITNYQLQNFTVTVSQQLGKIPQKLKELSFCQLEGHLNLNLHLNSKMIIQRINCLQILSFSNVTFSSLSYNLVKNLFLNNRNIKKLAFSHCFLQFSKLITNFEHLNRGTLRQLLLEANECQPKEALNQENCQLIASFHHLQVLIIVNFYFFNRKNEFEQISGFCEIGALINLNYLNLYNSQPIFSDFLQYLDPNTHQNMRTLNLGLTKIDSLAVEALSKFVGLQTLVLDFTSINGKDFIQITKDMQNLRKLSLQRAKQFYNSEEIGLNYLEANSQELVKCQDFERLSHKTLEYVNICGCRGLKEYQWSSFIRLKIIKFNNSQLGSEAKNRLNLLKIQLYQEQQGPSVGGANIKIPDGKKQGSEKQKETGKLQGVQQIFNNSSKKFAKPNSLVRFNQLVSRRKSHQAKKSKTSVYSRSCVICEHSQQRKPRERTPKLGKRITKVKTEVGRWEGNRAANLEINKIKFEQGQL